MKFNSKQLILTALTVGLCSILFMLGFKSPFGSSNPKGDESIVLLPKFDASSYIAEEKRKLSGALQDQLAELEEEPNKHNYIAIAAIWDSLKVSYAAAAYTLKAADLDKTEFSWLAAGNRFYNVANFSNDSAMMLDALQQAKQSYNKVLELNPNNLQAKTALAVCIIQGDNDVMKGVGLLKEVVAKDSNNVQAIFTLGMLSIQSNQLDKAQERFEKLIKIEPFNAEYYFYLAEVYAKSGDTKKAVKTYETCKTLVKDKEAQKEIDAIIEKLNKL